MDIFHERLNILYDECLEHDADCGKREFAQLCKVSFYKIDKYLRGKGMPTFETLRIISSSLNVNPLWLMGVGDEARNEKYILQDWIKELDQNQLKELTYFAKYLKFKSEFGEFILYKNK